MYIGPKNSEIDLLVRDEQIGYCGWANMDELKSMGLKAREVAEKKYSKTIILNKFLETI